jgi:hypothetical protein
MLATARFFLVIAVLSITAPAAARLDENSVCGAIESGQLTVPSYRLRITDQRGNPVANLTGRGQLLITEGVWRGHWYEGYWVDENHDVAIGVSYDAGSGHYVSEELPKVMVAQRKKGWTLFKTTCWDRVRTLRFSFARQAPADTPMYGGSFVFHFPNKTVDEIGLPDPSVPINIFVRDKR